MSDSKIKKCIKMAMIRGDISSPELAKALNVSEDTVVNYRAGKTDSIKKLTRIATACGMNYEDMMKLAD